MPMSVEIRDYSHIRDPRLAEYLKTVDHLVEQKSNGSIRVVQLYTLIFL